MKNWNNMQYRGKYWLGSPPQEMEVMFDLGSAYTWVFCETCGVENKQCPLRDGRYKESQSKSYSTNTELNKKIKYGTGQILGNPSLDVGCFSKDPSTCISKISFLSVFEAESLEKYQGTGLIGLAPTPSS